MNERFKIRPLSWSQLSCWEYSQDQWYKRYVLNEKQPESAEMLFGKEVGKKLETDPTFLPMIERHSKMEHPFRVKFLDDIYLIGYADTFCDKTFKKLSEFKTGKKEWNQERVDKHGQIDMYLLMNYLTTKTRPEDVEVMLVWMPTQEFGNFKISFVEPIEHNIQMFKTKRTMTDILKFGKRITDTVKAMESYAQSRVDEAIPCDTIKVS